VTATVDTTNPSETISSTIGTNTGATTTISSGGVTKDNTLALSGTVGDANLSSVHVFDGATDWARQDDQRRQIGASPPVRCLTASQSFTAKATDAAGNVTTTAGVDRDDRQPRRRRCPITTAGGSGQPGGPDNIRNG